MLLCNLENFFRNSCLPVRFFRHSVARFMKSLRLLRILTFHRLYATSSAERENTPSLGETSVILCVRGVQYNVACCT